MSSIFMFYDFSKFTKEELLKIESTLNRWEWPEEIGEKPAGWDDMPWHTRDPIFPKRKPSEVTRFDIISFLNEDIFKYITWKESLNYHHVNHLKMTEEEISEYWENQLVMRRKQEYRKNIGMVIASGVTIAFAVGAIILAVVRITI